MQYVRAHEEEKTATANSCTFYHGEMRKSGLSPAQPPGHSSCRSSIPTSRSLPVDGVRVC